MVSYTSIIAAFFLTFLTSFRASAEDFNLLYQYCPNTTTFTRNSTYSANLRTLLSSLSSPNASYSAGFQNATAGQSPDLVTGLFLCRGDLSHEACRDCVVFAVEDIRNRCPEEKEAGLWYDNCLLRYSHTNILSRMTTYPGSFMKNNENVTGNQLHQFEEVLVFTMNEAIKEATYSSRKFAVRKTNFTLSQTVYGLVQCTPDITRDDCNICLQQAVSLLPRQSIGGRLFFSSCTARFELYPFFNETAIENPFPPAALTPPRSPGKRRTSVIIIAVVVPTVVAAMLFIGGYCLLAKTARKSYNTAPVEEDKDFSDHKYREDITTAESLQFDFMTIEAATNNFSESNRLGQGGFGEVYKGTLPNGKEVAVKRLSETSGQGTQEFKKEVVLVAKLQHRNLVRLLGFCLEGEEKILVLEFVPNKSLNCFLFDSAKQSQLDWTTRYKIIGGVARGILYLHQDSRIKIVHRDLKASNILLDANMNPKISDFGMARFLGADQSQDNYTSRVVGTYGYMSPEYALHGQFSTKSDVYSFGVLVLEIISGKKNSPFYQTDGVGDLVTYAWRLWRNGSPLELLDPAIGEKYQRNEVNRCIHVGLLCIQEDPADRPTMSSIIPMLTGNTINLPVPSQPLFFFRSGREPNQLAMQLESN